MRTNRNRYSRCNRGWSVSSLPGWTLSADRCEPYPACVCEAHGPGECAGCCVQATERGIEVGEHSRGQGLERRGSAAQRPQRRRQGAQRVVALAAARAELVDLALGELARERLLAQGFEFHPGLRLNVGVLELPLDPHQRVGVGELRYESLRVRRQPFAVRAAKPVVELQITIERCSLQAEPLGRVALHAVVLERAVELLVAHFGEQRRGTDVGDLHVLEVPFEHERDLRGALRRRDRSSHGKPIARGAPAAQATLAPPGTTAWPQSRKSRSNENAASTEPRHRLEARAVGEAQAGGGAITSVFRRSTWLFGMATSGDMC